MKRYFLAASAVLLLCTGCADGGDNAASSDDTAAQSQKVTTIPEADKLYSDYEEFAESYKEQNPEGYELPLPEEFEELEIKNISLNSNRYVISYSKQNDESQSEEEVKVTVEHTMTDCPSIDAFYRAQNSIPDSEITKKTEDYLIRVFGDGRMELTTIMGENNTICRLTVEKGDMTEEEQRSLLFEYKDIMGM